MNELTTEERLMLWDALFAGYFGTPYTPAIAETVFNMTVGDIRVVLRTYANAMKIQTTDLIAEYEGAKVELAAKIVTYEDVKASIDVSIGVEVVEEVIKEGPIEDLKP